VTSFAPASTYDRIYDHVCTSV